jgi:competence protein ComEA
VGDMSRRDAAATAGHTARHARNRLQATLGNGSRGLLTDGTGDAFQYDGGMAGGGQGPSHAAPSQSGLPGAAGLGPSLRWRLGLRVALFIGVVAILAGAWFWWQVAAARPDVVPLSDVTQSEGAPTVPAGADNPGQGDSQPGGSAPAVLHMAGAVVTPGVVELPSGSRVHEAIAAAGGSTAEADLDRLNLASVVADGQKIYVPRHGEALPADPSSDSSTGSSGGGAGAGGAGAPGEKTNLNTAGVEELGALPKVGPVLAQRIVDWRKEHGPFKTVEELDAVDGVGPKMLETLLPLVSV